MSYYKRIKTSLPISHNWTNVYLFIKVESCIFSPYFWSKCILFTLYWEQDNVLTDFKSFCFTNWMNIPNTRLCLPGCFYEFRCRLIFKSDSFSALGPILPTSEFRKFSVSWPEIIFCYRGKITDIKLEYIRPFWQFSDQHM